MAGFYTNCINILMVLIVKQIFTTNAVNQRIIGGSLTSIDKVKYLVSLRERSGSFFCGGSLVSDSYVVTAAHCVVGMRAQDIMVHGGTSYLNNVGISRSVVRVDIPPPFTLDNLYMDVAVLKLNKSLRGRYVSEIPLCSSRIPDNSWVTVSGWGFINEKLEIPSNQVRTVDVRMIRQEDCRRDFKSVMIISKTMMCAAVRGERDSCVGDSGGPLVYQDQLCGVVSFGVGCARKRFPGVYTSIIEVERFIHYAMSY